MTSGGCWSRLKDVSRKGDWRNDRVASFFRRTTARGGLPWRKARRVSVKCRWPWIVFLSTVALAAIAEPAVQAAAKTFKLSVTGGLNVRFDAHCVAFGSGEERVLAFRGTVPVERTIVAEEVRCRLQSDGRIIVELSHDSGRSRSVVDGGTAYVAGR